MSIQQGWWERELARYWSFVCLPGHIDSSRALLFTHTQRPSWPAGTSCPGYMAHCCIRTAGSKCENLQKTGLKSKSTTEMIIIQSNCKQQSHFNAYKANKKKFVSHFFFQNWGGHPFLFFLPDFVLDIYDFFGVFFSFPQ